jgi:predicted AAA+ superfamily ATPase
MSGTTPLALVLVAAALVASSGFQTWSLIEERGALAKVKEQQTAPLENVAKIEKQLDALAGGTATMAEGGNANARAIVAEFQARGVTISKPKPKA